MTVYEIEKQLKSNDPVMDEIMLRRKCYELQKFLDQFEYSMLYNKERSDYTLFKKSNHTQENQVTDLKDILKYRGDVLLIQPSEEHGDYYRIWIRDRDTAENFCYLAFDYTDALVVLGDQ